MKIKDGIVFLINFRKENAFVSFKQAMADGFNFLRLNLDQNCLYNLSTSFIYFGFTVLLLFNQAAFQWNGSY